jgi:copper chaperone NosL
MTRRRFLRVAIGGAAAAVAAPALWALATRQGDESGAPEIAYGRDRCEQCGMIIGDRRFAAATRGGSTVHRFDDIGCLIRHSADAAASGHAKGFVHDAGTEAWIDAPHAWYVRSPAIRTPMNYNIAAYADNAEAHRAYPKAPVMTLDDLLAAMAKEQS